MTIKYKWSILHRNEEKRHGKYLKVKELNS